MRLLIADDHALTRAGIRVALEQREEFLVVGETDTGPKVVPLVAQTEPDVVLLDTEMPGLDSLTCLERMRARFPGVAVIMLAFEATPARLEAAFSRGARGWILQTIEPDELGPAIVHALSGTAFTPYGPISDDGAAAKMAGLSGRELEVIRLVGRGYSNKQIAKELWLSVQTVKFHLTNTYRKLGLPNRTAAARWAHQTGLLLGAPVNTGEAPVSDGDAPLDGRLSARQRLSVGGCA